MKVLTGLLVIFGITTGLTSRLLSQSIFPINPGCNVKGNISIATKEKFYHIPGMRDYKSTVISPEKGEKWFCSESEAISNGWVKAPDRQKGYKQ